MIFVDAFQYFLKVGEASGVPEVLVVVDVQDWLERVLLEVGHQLVLAV